ncbi:MAG: prolipoprotein diacylglyceryl transferase [Clostridia bacterium]|nr:prolipoprotein diacylglyceryl transferase [Clostridia bacterium]
MNNIINIFGKEIPLYGLLFFAGIILASCAALPLAKKRGFDLYDIAASAAYAMIGAIVGAKLLFIVVSIKEIIELELSLLAIIKGGFVFYGGLIGGAIGILIYIKQYQLDPSVFDIYAAVLPLGHALGRVGCFFAGCCYGIPHDGFASVVYTSTMGLTPLNEPLLAIQLIEAACLLLLFAVQILVFCLSKRDAKGLQTSLYLCIYPVMRFVLEFFRGDRERGILLGLSTAQWVSIAIFALTWIFIIRQKIKETNSI